MSKYCGHCGSEIDARLGFCPKCDAEKIHTLWEQPAGQKALQEEIQAPAPEEKPDRKTRKAQRKAKKKAARKAYRATWTFGQKFWDFIWKLVLAIAVLWLVTSLLVAAVGFFLFQNPSYVFEALDNSGLELEQVVEDSQDFVNDYMEKTDLDLEDFSFFSGEEAEVPAATEAPSFSSDDDAPAEAPVASAAPNNPAATEAISASAEPSAETLAASVAAAVVIEETVPATQCSHNWTGGTCSEDKVCSLCGDIDSYAQGHSWISATYELPKHCTICGETEGESLGKTGDILTFGSFDQDKNTANGKEPLEWEILEIDGNDLLVISKYALACRPYHSSDTSVTWATCSLRSWLGSTFLDTAFTAEEQARILTTQVSADPNPQYSTEPGISTQDKIFLLSLGEAERYFTGNSHRMTSATPTAVSQGAYVNPSTGGSWWWLRSPGNTSKDAASVNSNGTIDYDDGSVNSDRGTVRPVMWIRMD